MSRSPPLSLVREAFEAAREKHFLVARTLYPVLFGAEWRIAILAFAYLKCLDDLVDEDLDPARALVSLERQRAVLARGYAGDTAGASAPLERFGAAVFACDRSRGALLRDPLETILSTMEFDTRRRGEQLDAAALDAYVLRLGSSVLRLFAQLTAPGILLPARLVAEGSRAYLYADTLIDLHHDLALGVINVPREDIARHALCCRPDDVWLREWVAERAPVVLAHFTRALAYLRTLPSRRLRGFLMLYLAGKRRRLRRHLAAQVRREDYAQAATAAAGRGSV